MQLNRSGATYRLAVAVALPSSMKKSVTLEHLLLYQLKYKAIKL